MGYRLYLCNSTLFCVDFSNFLLPSKLRNSGNDCKTLEWKFQDYKTDLYLRQKWKDERLKHKDLKQPLDLSDPNLVKVNARFPYRETHLRNKAFKSRKQFIGLPVLLDPLYSYKLIGLMWHSSGPIAWPIQF